MRLAQLLLGFVLVLLVAQNPQILAVEQRQNDYFFVSRRREPTIHEVIVANFRTQAEKATKVFKCESGLSSVAQSKTNDHGIAQINLPSHRAKIPGKTDAEKIAWLRNYKNNIRLAYSLYENSGWNPWRSSQNCWE